MAMTEKELMQAKGLAIGLAVAAGVLFWLFVHQDKAERATQMEARIDTLTTQIDSVRALLEETSAEELEQRIADWETALESMREFVPSTDEVPALLNDITEQTRRRGVSLLEFAPQADETSPDGRFVVKRYHVRVLGGYDAIGEFITDIASLPRIMVPYDVSLGTPEEGADTGDLEIDTTSALVEADFYVRTFVKSRPVSTTDEPGATSES